MDPELRDLLREVTVDGTEKSATHSTLYGPNARWTVPPANQGAFWKGYCDLVRKKADDPQSNLCLAERPIECMPLITKLTFRYHADDTEHDDPDWEPYDDEFLYWVVHFYQVALAESVHIQTTNFAELISVVLESNTHWYEEDRESGRRFLMMEVRVHFPYAHVDVTTQNRVIRPKVIQMLRNNNIMSKLQRAPVGDWDQIISSSVVNEPITLYGSSEVQGRPKLKLAHVWAGIGRDTLDSGNQIDELPLKESFMPENHSQVLMKTLPLDTFSDNYDLEYWLPMFTSIGYWSGILVPQAPTDNKQFSSNVRVDRQSEPPRIFGSPANTPTRTRQEDTDIDMELAERFLPMINTSRFSQEGFWINIGRALYSSDEGGENGLLSWIRHTERAISAFPVVPDFTMVAGNLADTSRDLYQTFGNNPITWKTLAWYAREDSPDRFSSWHREWCLTSMEQALTCYHTDVTVALYRVYFLEFVYCSIGKGRWYQYRNHRWTEISQGMALRRAISRDFMRRFESLRMNLSRQIHDSHDDAFKANGEITMKKITQLIGKLKTQPFKGSIMGEASEHFNNDRFVSLLDLNADLTGYTNGIVEVTSGKAMFRRGMPEDYISMCTNIPFLTVCSWDHPLVKEVMTWLSRVFPDKPLLHHFLKFAASCLKGRNSDKIFSVWTGGGDNSKSMIVKLFEAALGAYCIKLPVILLSEKGGNSSGPTPQLARAKSTRVAFLDEPEDDVPIHKGTIKRYTGGDSFFARMLQDNGGDVQATFKMVLMCNKVPIIPNADKAIKNRTRLFPFLSTWTDNPPEDEAEQMRQRLFKKNVSFEKRIPIMAPAFAWIMSQYYPYYTTEGLVDPTIVTETTDAYWRDNDVYAQFAADTIQEVYTSDNVRDSSARCTLSEIYTEFKMWFRDAFPGTKVPERSIVRTELSSRWGRMVGTAWHGIRIATSGSTADMNSALGGRKQVQQTPQPKIIGEVAHIPHPPHIGPVVPKEPTMNIVISPKKSPKALITAEHLTKPLSPKPPMMQQVMLTIQNALPPGAIAI